ncbi:13078_t:CDS:2, partial [Gigaspora rosea]
GEYFRNQSEKKQTNFLNKQREIYDNEKKRKENRFKKNEFAIKEDFDENIRFTKFREQYHLENEYSSSNEESQSYQEPEQYKSSSDSSESEEYE